MVSGESSDSFFSALSIAGSDPSGGAGIQVDLKAFSAVGVWGMAVIAALTAQNSSQVTGSWAVDPDIVKAQIITLLKDITPGAIKTGMLADAEIIRVVSSLLPEGAIVVVDPVMVSTSGHRLLDEDAVEVMRRELLPRAKVVTPNIPEACVLTGWNDIRDEEEMTDVGREIIRMGPSYVVMKGGHGSGAESVDLLISDGEVLRFSGPRYPYEVHGSGCCFSAALAGYLSSGMGVPEACGRTKELVHLAIDRAVSGRSGKRMIFPY